MEDYTDELVKKIIASGIATQETIEPCSQKQITDIEQQFAVSLPEAYKIFLSKMGSRAGTFMRGTDLFYRHLPNLRQSAERLLNRWDNPFVLSNTDFVFLGHQGNQFMYFDTSSGDDPPVFHYVEAQYKPKKVNPSFSNWLECRVEESLVYSDKRKERDRNKHK